MAIAALPQPHCTNEGGIAWREEASMNGEELWYIGSCRSDNSIWASESLCYSFLLSLIS